MARMDGHGPPQDRRLVSVGEAAGDEALRRMLAQAAIVQENPQPRGMSSSFKIHGGFQFQFLDPGLFGDFLQIPSGENVPTIKLLSMATADGERSFYIIGEPDALAIFSQLVQAFGPEFATLAREALDKINLLNTEDSA